MIEKAQKVRRKWWSISCGAAMMLYLSLYVGDLVHRTGRTSFLAVYIGLSLLYMGSFVVLENGLVKSRGPMLSSSESCKFNSRVDKFMV
jgi:hypothetical protein